MESYRNATTGVPFCVVLLPLTIATQGPISLPCGVVSGVIFIVGPTVDRHWGQVFIITGAVVKVPVRCVFCKHRPPFWVAYTQEGNRGVRGMPGFTRHCPTAFQDGCAAGHSANGTLNSRHTTRSSTLGVWFHFSPPRGGEEVLRVALTCISQMTSTDGLFCRRLLAVWIYRLSGLVHVSVLST